jgi:hypothetical protein
VENGVLDPDQTTLQAMNNSQRNKLAKQRKHENTTKYWIHCPVDDLIFPKITKVFISNKPLDILELSYHGNNKGKTMKRQILRREFETLNMKEEENIDQVMTRVTGVVNRLNICG